MKQQIKLSVLFVKEADSWVGQCLEHDIAAQGKTMEAAKIALRHTLAGQMFLDTMDGKRALASIPPAPSFYNEKFQKAEKLQYRFELELSDDDCTPEIEEDIRVALV